MIYLTEETKFKLLTLARLAASQRQSEIGGLGSARRLDRNSVLVYDVWPLKHESSGQAHADLDDAAVNAEIVRLDAIEQANPDTKALADCRVWFHSHPAGGPNDYSSTDNDTITKLRRFLNAEWVVGLLTNGTWVKGRLQVFEPFELYLPMAEVGSKTQAEITAAITIAANPLSELLVEKAAFETRAAAVRAELATEKAAIEARMATSIGEIVNECLPERPKYLGGLGLQPIQDYIGPGAQILRRYPGSVGNGKQNVWDNFCNFGNCHEGPRFITSMGTQICEKHIRHMPAGTKVGRDRKSNQKGGVPKPEILKAFGVEFGEVAKPTLYRDTYFQDFME